MIIIQSNGELLVSVAFTWELPKVGDAVDKYGCNIDKVVCGGPAVSLMPQVIECDRKVLDWREWPKEMAVLHDPDMTFTTRGCIRNCGFCAVPKTEGNFVELLKWTPRRKVCDNNLLASSKRHFDAVIDSLKHLSDVDFNQGLDASLMTKYRAGRLAELKLQYVRLAFDRISQEAAFLAAVQVLRAAGIPKSKIAAYVLVGFQDDFEDAMYRVNLVRDVVGKPFVMRYQPLDTLRRNSFVPDAWDEEELKKFCRYFNRLKYTSKIPYKDFDNSLRRHRNKRNVTIMAPGRQTGE